MREFVTAAASKVRTLYFSKSAEQRLKFEINSVRENGGKIAEADEATLNRLAGSSSRHQGVVAIVREHEYAPFEQILEEHPDPLVLVDGVTDPRNLGALIRSAECAGVSAIVLARDRTVGLTPAAIKASAGAWVHVKIARCGNVVRTLEMLKSAGYWIAALVPDGPLSIYQLDTTRRLAVVVGSEGRGLRDLVKRNADFAVKIPMRGRVESLNVSVAAAVALFEIARRRESAA